MAYNIPHFTLAPSLVQASSLHEVKRTLDDMIDCGLFDLPFSPLALTFGEREFVTSPNWYYSIEDDLADVADAEFTAFIQKPTGSTPFVIPHTKTTKYKWDPQLMIHNTVHVRFSDGHHKDVDMRQDLEPEMYPVLMDLIGMATMLLICGLNTTNAVKQVSVNNRAPRGQGSSKFRGPSGVIYVSSTRLSAPTLTSGTGSPVRPHMRRGHIHTFAVGEGRTGRVQKFIQPIFVNADQMTIKPAPAEYRVRR